MQRLAIAVGLFLVLCVGVFVLGGGMQDPPAEAEKNQAMETLKACMRSAESAESALDRNNYGEARADIAAVQKQLNELVFLLAEEK